MWNSGADGMFSVLLKKKTVFLVDIDKKKTFPITLTIIVPINLSMVSMYFLAMYKIVHKKDNNL